MPRLVTRSPLGSNTGWNKLVRQLEVADITAFTALLDKNPQAINEQTYLTKNSLLHLACKAGNRDAAAALLVKGANHEMLNRAGDTALDCAKGDATRALLLSYGAKTSNELSSQSGVPSFGS